MNGCITLLDSDGGTRLQRSLNAGIAAFAFRSVCGPCGRSDHDGCTDPFGDRQDCPCSALPGPEGEGHRLAHELWADTRDSNPGDLDESHIEGSRTLQRWAWDAERFEDSIRERG